MESIDETFSKEQLSTITNNVIKALKNLKTPGVEQIQDAVEKVLIAGNFASTAKAYILYRAEHTKLRQAKADLMDIYDELTFTKAKDADIKRENANIDADTAMGTMLKYGSEGSKYFITSHILPKDIAVAHMDGDIHIHDMDFYMLTETCCQIDLLKLFKNGFSTGHGYLREPNDIRSYAALACIAIQANQNEMHGGQAVPMFDYCMAPGVAKTYRKQYYKALGYYFNAMLDMKLEDASLLCKKIEQSLPIKISMSTADKFGKLLVDFLPKHQREHNYQEINEQTTQMAHKFAINTAWNETNAATYQAMEAFIHNLNTMNSRAGAQVPFSSINYGTDTSPEGRMAMRNLLLATDAGLGDGETPIFPVQIFKVKEGVMKNISIKEAAVADHFAYDFHTLIQIPEKGIYRFYTFSDDGSMLYIDGKLVVDNDGGHSARRAEGKIALEKGFHELHLLYFEDYMGQELEVGFSGLDFPEVPLQDEMLFLPN